MNRLEQKYKEVVTPSLMKKFNYKSVMEVPHVDKIVINMGIGEAISNPKVLDEAVAELAQITGQAPVITKAKKSIANFKLREGMPIGCKVTLRKEKMYDFMDKLMNISLPRVRDFRGVSATSFDGRGNYTLGVKEQLIFPEIDGYRYCYDSQHERRSKGTAGRNGHAFQEIGGLRRIWQKKQWLINQNVLRSTKCASTPDVSVVDVLTQFYVNTNSAVFASVSWLTKVRSRV